MPWQAGVKLGLPNIYWLVFGIAIFMGTVLIWILELQEMVVAGGTHPAVPATHAKAIREGVPAIDCRRTYIQANANFAQQSVYAVFSNEPKKWIHSLSNVGNTQAALTFAPLNDMDHPVFEVVTAAWKGHDNQYWVDFGASDINELVVVQYCKSGEWRVPLWDKQSGTHRLATQAFRYDGDMRVRIKFRGNYHGEYYLGLVRDKNDELHATYLRFVRR